MRVNARFEGVAEKQVEYLAASTGNKVSDVLRDSVDFYYRHLRAQSGQLKYLSNLIGKGDSGLSDISTNVKKYLTMALDEKYPVTPAEKAKKTKVIRTKPGA